MNTRQKRAVVALVVAIATLATMGFRAPHDEDLSILAATCDVLGSYTAIELLSVLDEPCFAGLVDQVEFEIDHGGSATSAEALVNSILERSRAVAPSPTGDQIETESTIAPSSGALPTSIPDSASFSGPSAFEVPLEGLYTNARSVDVSLSQEAATGLWPNVGFGGPSFADVPLEGIYTNARTAGVSSFQDAPTSFGPNVGFSGPSFTDVPLEGIYTNARSIEVSFQYASVWLGPRVGFSGPSAADVPLESVYTNAVP